MSSSHMKIGCSQDRACFRGSMTTTGMSHDTYFINKMMVGELKIKSQLSTVNRHLFNVACGLLAVKG